VDHFENDMDVIAGVSCFKTEEMPNDLSCVPCLVASGYTSCALGHLFEYAPTEIEYSLKQLMDYLEHLRRGQISHMREIHALYNSDCEEHGNAFQSMQSMQREIIDEEDRSAVLMIRYEARSQRQTEILFNRALVDLVGVPQEEAQGRFAEYGPCLPMPIQDCLYALVDNVLNQSEQQLERYFRLCCSTHDAYQARLVAGVQLKSFDSVGQIVQVVAYL
jgi:hypothetical protein